MASQKPPVAFVSRVTLIFSGAAALPLPDDAAAPPLLLPPPHAVRSIAPAPSAASAFSRVDMCCPFLSGLPHVSCVQEVKLQTFVPPRAPTIQDTSCSWWSA